MHTHTPPTFVIPGVWSTNIGNAFYGLGVRHVLEAAIPCSRVELLSDQAAYLNMLPGGSYRREPRNSLGYLAHLRPDYVVLAGSVLTEQFPRVWGPSFESLSRAGTRVLLVGAGQYDYSPDETVACRELLKRYPPYVLISRDHQTYENMHDLAEYAYDGIDGAYFVPDVFEPIDTDLPPYVVLNFDKTPEPRMLAAPSLARRGNDLWSRVFSFEFQSQAWSLRFPRLAFELSRLMGIGFSFTLGLAGLHGTRQKGVGGLMIVRTDHELNPLVMPRLFRGPNAFAGDIPYSYLNIYSQAELTLTDRVHAALVTLAYGRPAMLFTKSGRAAIIGRVGGGGVTSKPTWLDMAVVGKEKQAMIDFVRAVPW